MPKDIQGVVVITGASSGIGRAAALEFARHGAHVVVAARRENLLQDVAHECQQLSGRDALAVVTDVSNEQSVENLARQTFEHLGISMCGSITLASGPMDALRKFPQRCIAES